MITGVPANTGAGRGYLSPSGLQPVIQYSAKYSSFGGVMMWDASQAYTNGNFIGDVKSILSGLGSKLKSRSMKWGIRASEA
jgi:chitinase